MPPPKWLEKIVGILMPPACREELLGDLHQRFLSKLHYIADAWYTVPAVICSRIRRTQQGPVVLMEALALYASFVTAARWVDEAYLVRTPFGLTKLAIPAAAALAALVLNDVYADPRKRSPLRPLIGAALAALFAFATQSLPWTLPIAVVGCGTGMGIALVTTLRWLFPPDESKTRGA
jgi:hypothetical protein